MRKRSIFWGLILLGGGVLIILNALGIGEKSDLVPMLGSLLLAAISIASFVKLNFVMGFLPLSVITYLWRGKLGLPEDLEIWTLLLAALLLGIGMSIIFWRVKRPKIEKYFHRVDCSTNTATTSTDDNEEVTVESSFGENVKYIRSTNLKIVKVYGNFSSIKVFFDECKVSPEGATIFVDCNFSGVELHVPRTWNIDNQTHVVGGSVEGATLSSGDFTTVKLIGDVHFGSVKIVYL
jgi:hypothetical protein